MKKVMRRQEVLFPWQNLLLYLLFAYIVSALVLVLLAVLVFKAGISQQMVSGGIILAYVLSCFLGGLLAGKKMKQKRFLWGLVMGLAYFLVLFLVSVIVNKSLGAVGDSLLTSLVLCAGGGMLGGMLS